MISSLPPRPFWKMSIEELKKYSQQMVKYDKEQILIKSKKYKKHPNKKKNKKK